MWLRGGRPPEVSVRVGHGGHGLGFGRQGVSETGKKKTADGVGLRLTVRAADGNKVRVEDVAPAASLAVKGKKGDLG